MDKVNGHVTDSFCDGLGNFRGIQIRTAGCFANGAAKRNSFDRMRIADAVAIRMRVALHREASIMANDISALGRSGGRPVRVAGISLVIFQALHCSSVAETGGPGGGSGTTSSTTGTTGTSTGSTGSGGSVGIDGGSAGGVGGTGPVDDGGIDPSKITLAAYGANATVGLEWPRVAGATGYRLYWSNMAGVTPESGQRIEVAGPTYVHRALSNGMEYHYVVSAVTGAGDGPPSAEVIAKPGGEWALEALGSGDFDDIVTGGRVARVPIA